MSPASLLAPLALAAYVLDGFFGYVAPRALRGFAWIPFGSNKSFRVHPTHLAGPAPDGMPQSYRSPARATERRPRIDFVAFPEEMTNDNVRLVPLEGGMSAMLVTTAPLTRGEAATRIDAVAGPGPDRITLRARITPAGFLLSLIVVPLLVARWGANAQFFLVALLAGSVRTFISSRRGVAWALDATESRLSEPRDGVSSDEEDGGTEPMTTTKARRRVFLDAEEGKETCIAMPPSPRPPRRRARTKSELVASGSE